MVFYSQGDSPTKEFHHFGPTMRPTKLETTNVRERIIIGTNINNTDAMQQIAPTY